MITPALKTVWPHITAPAPGSPAHATRGDSPGFTLMEMLVTMVLFAVVSSLLWQALGMLARIETRLNDEQTLGVSTALREEWVSLALQGLMTGAQTDPRHFSGAQTRLSGYTSMPPWPDSLGPEFMELSVNIDGGQDASLVVSSPERSESWSLLPGQGRFAYRDKDGTWHDQWPPAQGKHDALPSAVRYAYSDGDILTAVRAMDNPMLRRADLGLE